MNSIKILQYNNISIAFDVDSDIMVNATQMAKPFGKLPTDFVRLQTTSNYVQALCDRYGKSRNDLLKVVRGGVNQGTWMHHKLALRYAQWLSPEFTVWVDEKIEELLTAEKADYFLTELSVDRVLNHTKIRTTQATDIKDGFCKNGRGLQELLGSKESHTQWSKVQVERLGLIEGKDFLSLNGKSTGGRPKSTYYFTEEAAHRIAGHSQVKSEGASMVKDNNVVNTLAAQGNEDAILLRAMGILNGRVDKLTQINLHQAKHIEESKPKVEAYHELMECTNAISMKDLAGVLAIKGMGRNNLFKYLRDKGILDTSNKPYQYYINLGWFKLKESYWENPHNGERTVNTTTKVMQVGVDGIRKTLKKDGFTSLVSQPVKKEITFDEIVSIHRENGLNSIADYKRFRAANPNMNLPEHPIKPFVSKR